MKNQVLVHFHTAIASYFEMNLWQWQDHQLGKEVGFERFDSFGAVAKLTYHAPTFLRQVYVIAKEANWSRKSVDYTIHRNSGVPVTEVWIVDGDDRIYYSRQAAETSHFYRHRRPHAFDMAMRSSEFDRQWGFDGWLGTDYEPEQTTFRVWAPTVKKVELVLYQSSAENASVHMVVPMEKGDQFQPDNHRENTHGVWEVTIPGNLDFHAYRYRVYYHKRNYRDTRDPYSIATTADGKRSIILSPQSRTYEGFAVRHGKEATWRLDNPNQAVILETHVRDMTKSVTSGLPQELRGRYLGACKSGTVNDYGQSTGIDYIKNLGVSHVQFMPLFDHHQTFDEQGEYAYNWGYDPENYNVPEASFSSNPHEPASRILELKEMIQTYHDAGLGVVMDVVYNHTYSSLNSPFQLTVPDYYYRMNADGSFQDGSGCGNETASEKEMFRKYMLDSIRYWIEEYNVDGFRFDLMGLHDVETMRQIRAMVDSIDPRILLYGEGWEMGQGLPTEQMASKYNADKMAGIGFFNDDNRNAIKGAEVYGHFSKGFVSGQPGTYQLVKSIAGYDEGSPYISPNQVLNYIEAHDNYNLNDLLWEFHPNDDVSRHTKRIELANAMNILSQGMIFLQLGQEFQRTKIYPTGTDMQVTAEDKQRAMNSYNAPDRVNQVNWNLRTFYQDSSNFVRELIDIKRHSDLFDFQSYDAIRRHVKFDTNVHGDRVISFTIENEHKKFNIIFNGNEKDLQINMTSGERYDILVSNKKRFHNQPLIIEELTAVVFEMAREGEQK